MEDKDVLEGGPEGSEQQLATQPTFGQKVKIGDQEFVVDEQFAKAYQEQQKALNGQMEEQRKQLQQLTASVSQLQQPSPSPEPKVISDPFDELGEMFFSDPAAAMRKFAELQRQEIKKESDTLRMGYKQDRAMESFWSRFWKKHKDLKKDQDESLALHIGDSIANDIKGMSEDQISEKIADGVRGRLKGYMERFGGEPTPTPHVEPGSGEFTPAPQPSGESKVMTLTDVIKQRAEKRRQASGKLAGTGGTK